MTYKLSSFFENLFSEITETPPVFSQKYLPSLDGFRALAIVLTIITHVMQTHFGPLGVQVFFVISGFLITTLLLKEKINKNTIELKKFYIRRFYRIIPVSWLYILIVFIISVITHSKINFLSYASATFFFANIINDTWFFAHYWSLSVEEQFYIFFPSLLKKMSIKKYVILLLIFLITIFIVRHFIDYFNNLKLTTKSNNFLHYVHYISFITNFDGIIVGSLFSIVSYKSLFKLKFSKFSKYLICLMIPILVFLVFEYFNSIFGMTIISILVSILIGLNLTPSSDYVFRFLNNKVIKHIGILSYSLYIWQQLFAFDRPWKNAFPFANSLILNMILLYITAYLSYNFFEIPFLKLRAKYK